MNGLWMFLAGCGLLTYLLLKRSYRYFGKSHSRRSSTAIERQRRPENAWDGVQRDTSALIDRQQVELHEMARDLSGQLNSKIILLEQLVADSQRQIERMEQLLAETKTDSIKRGSGTEAVK